MQRFSPTLSIPPEFPGPQRPEQHPRSEYPAPPVPIIYETTELEQMSLRTFAAIHLRVPDSGIEWLDEMIKRSRELDRSAA
jgi:hypothetical protein